jgi:hypothetical protein
MPIACADWRCWALVLAGIRSLNADQQRPAAVGAGTDADTVPRGGEEAEISYLDDGEAPQPHYPVGSPIAWRSARNRGSLRIGST